MAEALRAAGRDPERLGPDPETLRPGRRLRRAARRAGPRAGRPRPAGRGGHRHLAARAVADRLPGRGQPRRHHPAGRPAGRHARAGRRPCSPRGRPPTAHGCVATVGKVAGRAGRGQRDPVRASPPGWTPAAPTRPPCTGPCREVAAAADALGRGRDRGVLDPDHPLRRRPGRAAAAACCRTPRCSAPAPGTTPGSWPTAGIPTGDDLRPQPDRRSRTPRPSTPSGTTAWPGSTRWPTCSPSSTGQPVTMTTLLGAARLAAGGLSRIGCGSPSGRGVITAVAAPVDAADRDRRRAGRRRAARAGQRPQPRLPPGPARSYARRRRHVLDLAASRCTRVAARLDPDRYFALARAVYAEMVLAGITVVGEFHYLHHDRGGRRTPTRTPWARRWSRRPPRPASGSPCSTPAT